MAYANEPTLMFEYVVSSDKVNGFVLDLSSEISQYLTPFLFTHSRLPLALRPRTTDVANEMLSNS